MKPATAKTIDVTPDANGHLTPCEVSWERARELYITAEGLARQSGEKLIELANVLANLRAEFFAQGVGGGNFSRTSGRGARSSSSSIDHPFPRTTAGWQQIVRERLGISARTANRLIERGTKLELIRALADGQDVIFDDTTGTDKTLSPTPEIQRLASAMWVEVINGTVSAPRAWAGIVGEGLRTDGQDGVKQRAPVNHYRVMLRAIESIISSSIHWDDMQPAERAEIEQRWAYAIQFLPTTMQAVFRRK